MNISDVSEVIDRPERLICPPNLPDFVEGMVNLRGELIAAINLRTLYHLDPLGNSTGKIIIFNQDERKYGIIVDSVDAILSLPGSEAARLPIMGQGAAGDPAYQDVSGTLFSKTNGALDRPLMKMDLKSVVSRCSGRSEVMTELGQAPASPA